MRGPLWLDPRQPWDDEEWALVYAPTPASPPASIEVHVADDDEPRIAFGFQSAKGRKPRTLRRPSRQARALDHRRNR